MYENIMCSQRNRSFTSLHSPFILVYIYFIYLKTHNDITTNNKVTLALSMLRNSEKKIIQAQDVISLSEGGIWKQSKIH